MGGWSQEAKDLVAPLTPKNWEGAILNILSRLPINTFIVIVTPLMHGTGSAGLGNWTLLLKDKLGDN